MTGTLRPNRTVRLTSKQPPMRYIRYMTDVPEASAELVDLGAQSVVAKRAQRPPGSELLLSRGPQLRALTLPALPRRGLPIRVVWGAVSSAMWACPVHAAHWPGA